ncbi:MAG TPA: prepilin-type N-terminal cleavage/methylation domain-containing protein [Actinomycetota bacterium]
MTRWLDGQHGFSLLEVLAALGVFAVVTLGVVPLLGSALKASSTSRSETVAEEAARTIMERIQGTKWYVSYDAKPNKRVDILDLYYPQAASNSAMGQSFSSNAANAPLVGTGGVFTTTCAPPPVTANPACNFEVPEGHNVTIKTSFIRKRTPATTPETYEIVTPCVTLPCSTPYTAPYAWNSQGNDMPAATLMDVNVTVGWTQHGKARSFSLRAILGERKFSATGAVDAGPSPTAGASTAPVSTGVAKIHGNAVIDYVVQAQTGYSSSTAWPANGCPVAPCKSEGTYTFGMSESTINTEDTGSTADQTNKVADFRIVRTYPANQAPPSTPPPDLANVQGATAVKHAPPYSLTTQAALSAPTQPIMHPELPQTPVQAVVYGGEVKNVKVDIANELPQAEGEFKTYGTTSGIQETQITNSQIDYTTLDLDPTQPLFFMTKYTGTNPMGLGAHTKANTFALNSASRAVQTQSLAGFSAGTWLRTNNGNRSWNSFFFNNFVANVNCKATGNSATASATATWSVDLSGYYDPSNNGSTPNGGTLWTAKLNSSGNDIFNGASVPDALASLKALNPLEIDVSTNTNDIYLFEKRDASGVITQKGYFSDMTALKNPPTSVSEDGRTVTASIDGALRIDTASLNAAIPETQTSFSFIKTSCEAVDNR